MATQKYKSRVAIRCKEPGCTCQRLLEVEGTPGPRAHLLEYTELVCTACSHAIFQHEVGQEVPYKKQ
jgi:hypothetical protein